MAASPDVGTKLLAWIAAGTGTLLAYSAVKNRKPWDVLRDLEGEPIRIPTGGSGEPSVGIEPPGFGNPNDPTTPTPDFGSSVPRIRQIANRELQPTLVPIKPSGQLDKDAAASFKKVQQQIGADIPNVGAYRSYAVQAALYYGPGNVTLPDGSRRFADPRKSLHVVGLAIDIRSDYASKSEVKAAMAAAGWQNPRPTAEEWHWSYLVRG